MCFTPDLECGYWELCDHCEGILKLTKHKPGVSKIQPVCKIFQPSLLPSLGLKCIFLVGFVVPQHEEVVKFSASLPRP